MITLYQPPSAHGIPCLSPFGTKVETYLRMLGLAYRTRPGDPRKVPKGKVPYIKDDDGRLISDSSDIVDHLRRKHGDTRDDALTPAQRATGHMVRRTLEEHLYWVAVVTRWVEDEGYAIMRASLVPMFPKLIGGFLLDRVIRKKVSQNLWVQGLGRHERPDIYRRGVEDVDALAALLGDQPFLLGEAPTSVDCSVFAFTSGVLMFPVDNPLKRRMAGHANLVAYNDRMLARYFGDHPPGSSKP